LIHLYILSSSHRTTRRSDCTLTSVRRWAHHVISDSLGGCRDLGERQKAVSLISNRRARASDSRYLSPPHIFKPESLVLLPILIAISLLVLFVTFAIPPVYRKIRDWISPPRYDLLVDEDDDEPDAPTPIPHMPSGGLVSDFKLHIRSWREYGSVLVLWEVVRTLAIAALLGLSIYAAVQAEPPEESHRFFDIMKKHKKKKHKNHHDKLILGEYTPLELGEFGSTAFFVSFRFMETRN
jgi:hypothetical protein